VLATKAANPMGEGANRRGLSRKWLLQAADESLARLGTIISISTISTGRSQHAAR